MLDRIRRKLFLSLKVMNSYASPSIDDTQAEQNVSLKRHELMSILRKGSSAISGVENGLTLHDFLSSSIETILHASRSHDDARSTKMKKDAGDELMCEEEKRLVDAEEEERKLLQGVAQVQSRLFEGKFISKASSLKSHKQAAEEWRQLQKRARKSRIVTIDGYEVLAEHLGPEVVRPAMFIVSWSLMCLAVFGETCQKGEEEL
jgi:SWI/SNF-related matrix-associated actin-dependent regulator of chromatin subfamily A member 5